MTKRKCKRPLPTDIALKRQFENNENFADMVNWGLFQGEQLVKAEELAVADSAVEAQFQTALGSTKACRIADVLRMWRTSSGEEIPLVLLAVENQAYIDPLAVYRDLGLTFACLHRDVRKCKKAHAKAKDLRGDEYLAAVSKKDRFTPVFPLVVYTGNEPWDAATELAELYNFPKGTKRFWKKSWPITLVQARDVNFAFSSKENALLFDAIHAKASSDDFRDRLKEVVELCEPFANDTDMIEIVGGVLQWVGLPKAVHEHAKGEDMELVLDTWQQELIAKGKSEGEATGKIEGIIEGIIVMARAMHAENDFIIAQLMDHMDISKSEAENALKKYDKAAVKKKKTKKAKK